MTFMYHRSRSGASRVVILFASFVVILGSVLVGSIHLAHAAAFTEAYLRLDRMKASTTTGGTVCAKPATTGTEADVQVVFPTGFTVNSTASNWTVTTTNLPSGATAWAGIGTATAVSSQTVTFPSSDLTVGTMYCFNFASSSTLTTGTAGSDKTGTITTRTSGPATIDTSSYATAVISDDQVVVTATVPSTFSFALGTNTQALGTLSSSSITSGSGVSVTIATNAASGWITWLKSANTSLDSATTSETIETSGTVDDACTNISAGSDFYQLDVDLTTDSGTGDGTVTIDSEYNCGASAGGTYSATYTEIATANGTTGGDVITLVPKVAITAVKAAATDYTDTLTVVGAGRF